MHSPLPLNTPVKIISRQNEHSQILHPNPVQCSSYYLSRLPLDEFRFANVPTRMNKTQMQMGCKVHRAQSLNFFIPGVGGVSFFLAYSFFFLLICSFPQQTRATSYTPNTGLGTEILKKKFHFIFVLRETAIVERHKIQTNKQIKLWGKEHTAYGVLPVGGLLGTPVPASSNAQGEGIQ